MKTMKPLFAFLILASSLFAADRGQFEINDLLTFTATTHDPLTGSATDADSAPSYRVYEDETGTAILTGTMSLLDSSNTDGVYSEQITLSAANGLEVGKCYTIVKTATVDGVPGNAVDTFQVVEFPSFITDTLSQVSDINNAVTGTGVELSALAIDAIWDELLSGHTTVGTFGKTLSAIATGVDTDIPDDIEAARLSVYNKVSADTAALGSTLATAAGLSAVASDASDAKAAAESADTKIGTPTDTDLATDIANVATGVSGLSSNATVTADRVPKTSTFYIGSEGYRARNIVSMNAWSTGTRTLAFDLTELLRQSDTTINAVSSVTVVDSGSNSITTSNLRKHQSEMIALWDTAAMTVTGNATVTVTITTADSNTIVVTGTLSIQ